MTKLTTVNQKSLRNNAKLELIRLENIYANVEITELLNEFKNRFNVCETVYKVVLKEYQKTKGTKKNNRLTIDMRQVPYALEFAGFSFDKNFLKELFGSKSTNGMTIKKLRDAVTHGVDEKAKNEIILRNKEIFDYMNNFLATVKNYDFIEPQNQ